MTDTPFTYILKILALSVIISCGIRYLGPMLPISPSPTIAVVAILLPSTIMALLLGLRAKRV
ncbi:hypothetical protein BST81_12460 [Leptolyngbya sp. 'hensonii']|nr:hypothetical protein BST81_12460 [Leptolyngbya sp. 'hensonii']